MNFKKYATSYHRKSHLIILFLVRCTSGERDVTEDGGGGHVVSDRLSVELIFMKCSRSLVTIAHHLINHLRIKEEEGSIISVLWHFCLLIFVDNAAFYDVQV